MESMVLPLVLFSFTYNFVFFSKTYLFIGIKDTKMPSNLYWLLLHFLSKYYSLFNFCEYAGKQSS